MRLITPLPCIPSRQGRGGYFLGIWNSKLNHLFLGLSPRVTFTSSKLPFRYTLRRIASPSFFSRIYRISSSWVFTSCWSAFTTIPHPRSQSYFRLEPSGFLLSCQPHPQVHLLLPLQSSLPALSLTSETLQLQG